ncbi:hypothetical protein [Thioalkalivibrio sp.]|uniref:hypothetical protein n=1 Tax=Thioalkalivibrio sp. TaxID=2093813 RepID=UPI0039756615
MGLCPICGGSGFDRNNRVCTYCVGSGRDPYSKDPDPDPGGGGGRRPIPRSLAIVIIVAGLIAGFAVYSLNGANDNATGPAVLAFLGTVISGLALVRVLSNPLPLILLVVLFVAGDHYVFEGTFTPIVTGLLSDLWAQIRSFLIP